MKRRCRRLLSALLLAAVAAGSAGIPRGYARIPEGYSYTVTFYPGNQGSFASAEPLTVQSDTASVSFSGSRIRVTGLRYGDRVGYDAAMDGAIQLRDGSKYYAKGIRESGKDNGTVGASSFAVTGDREYVVAYGNRGNMVAYRVYYRDKAGNDLHPSRTCYGSVGDRPVAACAYVAGYLPQAYNLTRTLREDPEENLFTFLYTPIPVSADEPTEAPAIQPEADSAPPEEASEQPVPEVPGEPGTPTEASEAAEEPREIVDLDEEQIPLAEAAETPRSGPAPAVGGILCGAVGFGALGWTLLLLKRRRETKRRDRNGANGQ